MELTTKLYLKFNPYFTELYPTYEDAVSNIQINWFSIVYYYHFSRNSANKMLINIFNRDP